METGADISIVFKDYLITSNKELLDVEQIFQWLTTESYWALGIPYELVKRSFDNSFTVGILKNGEQVGYARLVTDYATFAYLADVFVKEPHRGIGLSKAMMQAIMGLDWLKSCRRLMLATRDAHGLYSQYGFVPLQSPDRFMELTMSGPYIAPHP